MVADEGPAKREIVRGRVVLLENDEVALEEGVVEDCVQVRVPERAALARGRLLHLLEG